MKKRFTLIEIMIVVAIVGIISAIAYPNYQTMRERSYQKEREAKSSIIKIAKERLAIDKNLNTGDEVTFEQLLPYIKPISSEADLIVKNEMITIGVIGTNPSYPSCTAQ